MVTSSTRFGALRTLVGFALVPPAAALIALPTYALMWATGLLPQGVPIDSLDSALGFGAGVAFLAVLVTVFCALPALSWLSERRGLSLGRLLALGAALGNVPFALVVLVLVVVQLVKGTFFADVAHYWYGAAGAAVRVVMGLIVGMGSAAVLWFVAMEGNQRWRTNGQ